MTNTDRLRLLLPPDSDISDLRLELLLSQAEDILLDHIGRDTLPERLGSMVVQIALRLFNRLGNEGESKRSENDISVSFSDLISDDMKARLKNYPRKVGAVCAADSEQT